MSETRFVNCLNPFFFRASAELIEHGHPNAPDPSQSLFLQGQC